MSKKLTIEMSEQDHKELRGLKDRWGEATLVATIRRAIRECSQGSQVGSDLAKALETIQTLARKIPDTTSG